MDVVNHPKHYNSADSVCKFCGKPIECLDVVKHMDFRTGNIIKYLWRHEHKNGIEDLLKAKFYLEDLINDKS